MLVGIPPNPMDFWPCWPEVPLSAALSLTVLGLITFTPWNISHAGNIDMLSPLKPLFETLVASGFQRLNFPQSSSSK